MKLDLTKLPVLEAIIGFLVIMIVVAFVGAFAATGGASDEGHAVTASATPRPSPADGETPPPVGPIEVILRGNRFDPDEITVQGGSTATFEITNEDGSFHNMHIAGPEGDYTEDFCEGGDPCSDPNRIAGGDAATLIWEVPDSPGEVDFKCDFHPQEMTGTITIE
jgi:plastocyanin